TSQGSDGGHRNNKSNARFKRGNAIRFVHDSGARQPRPFKAAALRSRRKKAKFTLDSGASDHFVGDRSLLTNIRIVPRTYVTGIHHSSTARYSTEEMGTISIEVTGQIFTFDAYYVPNLDTNYFSLSVFGEGDEEYVIINCGICRLEFEDTLLCVAFKDDDDSYTYEIGRAHV